MATERDDSTEKMIQCNNCERDIDPETGESSPDGRVQVECECGNILVECAKCGEFVGVMVSRSGPGRKPVHEDCFDISEVV